MRRLPGDTHTWRRIEDGHAHTDSCIENNSRAATFDPLYILALVVMVTEGA